MKGGANLPAEDPTAANLDDGELSSNQEATPVPWGAGEFMVAAKWITGIVDQEAREAPAERPGKK